MLVELVCWLPMNVLIVLKHVDDLLISGWQMLDSHLSLCINVMQKSGSGTLMTIEGQSFLKMLKGLKVMRGAELHAVFEQWR